MRADPVRVLVVDDDGAISGALGLALGASGYDVTSATDVPSALQVAERFRPDLAILDLRLPGDGDGTDLAALLRRSSDLPIIFLTAADDLDARVRCFGAGGDDYLAKPFSMAELILRVHALLRRAGRLSSDEHALADLRIDEQRHHVERSGSEVDLTPTEFRLLLVLVRHPGVVLSKRQLLEDVWGFDAYDENLVEVHLSSLRRKLERHGPRLLHTVRGVGYVARA